MAFMVKPFFIRCFFNTFTRSFNLILRQIFDVAVKMFTASSNETFTSSEFRSKYSLIEILIGSVRNVFRLNFKYESFSQQNQCRGKRSNLLVEFKVWVSLVGWLVLRFNHATIALWSDK